MGKISFFTAQVHITKEIKNTKKNYFLIFGFLMKNVKKKSNINKII